MFNTASKKLGLDRAILQRQSSSGSGESSSAAPSSLSKAEVENLLKKGAYCMLDDEESRAFCEADIDSILDSRTVVVKHDNNGAERSSIFSKVFFDISNL